jgi:hypothetical protein
VVFSHGVTRPGSPTTVSVKEGKDASRKVYFSGR